MKKQEFLESKKDEIEKFVKEGKTYKEIENIYNVHHSIVALIVRKYKFSHINEDYFNEINTEAKAYFLGFIFADGSIYRNNSKSSHCFEIGLHVKDLEILENFRKEVCPSHKIYFKKEACIINIGSKKLTDSLINYGIIPRKSHEIYLNFRTDLIPSELIRHFIRGYFDGDGHVGITKSRYFQKKKNVLRTYLKLNRFGFTSSHINFLKYITIIFENLGFTSRFYNRDLYTNNLHFNVNKKNIHIIYDYFYKNSNYFLTRKKKSFEIGLNNTEVSNQITKG